MKVSRKSWHFRMYRFLISLWTERENIFKGRRTQHVPRDLCHYFWTIVAMVLTFPLWIGAALWVLVFLGIMFACYWVYTTLIKPPFKRLGAWLDRNDDEAQAKKAARGPKQPGLIKSYVKAHKSKVCPIIEVIE